MLVKHQRGPYGSQRRNTGSMGFHILDYGVKLRFYLGESQTGGLAVTSRTALAALTFNNQLAIVDLPTGAVKKVKTGIAPFGVAVNAAGSVAWVSNWGGRFAKPGECPNR